MKDNFSKQASAYSKFRPQYSDEIIAYIISFVENKSKALDVATGNGQVAYKLENTFFENQEFDLITVAQAVHWFNFDLFYKEVYRILKPNGVIAILGYGLFSTNSNTDVILRDFYYTIVGPYWDAERKYLDENYQTIPFPFEEQAVEKFENQFEWSFEELIGYLETWSSVQHYIKKNKKNPLDLIRDTLKISWEENDKK